MKALYIYQKKRLPKTRNIVELASDLESPDEVIEACQELNPDYVTTRYVDAANGVPAKMYSHNSAIIHLQYAKTVIKWTQQYLPSFENS